MDIGKIFGLALVPVVIMAILSVITGIIGAVPLLNLIVCLIWPIQFLGTAALLLWAGYNAGKNKLDLAGAVITGLLAGLMGSIIQAIIGFVFTLIGSVLGAGVTAATGGDVTNSIFGFGFGFLSGIGITLVCIPTWTIGGAILGAIGGIVGGAK